MVLLITITTTMAFWRRARVADRARAPQRLVCPARPVSPALLGSDRRVAIAPRRGLIAHSRNECWLVYAARTLNAMQSYVLCPRTDTQAGAAG